MASTRNLLIAAAVAAATAPSSSARADSKKGEIDISRYREEMVVLHDGHGHFLAIVPFDLNAPTFYGDRKHLYKLDIAGGGSNARQESVSRTFVDPRVSKSAFAEIYLKDGKWSVECGKRETPLAVLDSKETATILEEAQFHRPLRKRRSHRLARDEDGIYYYVDRLREEWGGQGHRLFIGRKGSMVEKKLIDVVSDSKGELFVTRTGKLRVDNGSDKGVWIEGKRRKNKRISLDVVPTRDNTLLIFSGLGVYAGMRMGTPCDDM